MGSSEPLPASPDRGLPVFGLTVNPYDDRVLDPLSRPLDADLFTSIDGFAELNEIGNFLDARAAGDGPTFVLINGPDGSGRTSAANFVVSSWKVARPEDRQLLVPRPPDEESRSARGVLAEWLANVRNELRRNGPALPGALDAELERFFAAGYGSISFVSDLRYLLAAVDAHVTASGLALVAVFDNLDVVDLVPVAVSAFVDTRALVVVVTSDYPTQLESMLGEGGLAALPGDRSRVIQLGYLSDTDITELVRSRWEHAVKYLNADVLSPALPFDLPTLAPTLAAGVSGPRTLRRIMSILHELLEMRDAAYAGQPPPDEGQLRFSPAELEEQIRNLDKLSVEA